MDPRYLSVLLVSVVAAPGEGRDDLHFRIGDAELVLDHELYEEPVVLDLELATGSWDTPWDALLSYHAAMLDIETVGELRAHQRLDDGTAAPAYMEDEALVAAAREVLAGDVTIHGKLQWEDTTIYLYRYERRGVAGLSGIPFRRFDGEYCLVKDLTVNQPLFRELSIADWDVAEVHARRGIEPPARGSGWSSGEIAIVSLGASTLLVVAFLVLRRSR